MQGYAEVVTSIIGPVFYTAYSSYASTTVAVKLMQRLLMSVHVCSEDLK